MSSVKFNENQQKAINSRKNIVVSAGAGSGKTAVLSERFIELVKSGASHVDEILTITFTRKATSEMKERIYKKLISLKETDLTKAMEEIKRFPFCTISTIDSFCTSIVRSDCVRYGFTEEFSVIEESDFADQVRQIANSFIKENKDSSVIRDFIYRIGADSLIDLFTELGTGYLNIVKPIDVEKTVSVLVKISKTGLEKTKGELFSLCEIMKASLSPEAEKTKNNISLNSYLENLRQGLYNASEGLKLSNRDGKRADNTTIITYRPEIYRLANLIYLYNRIIESEDEYRNLYNLVAKFEILISNKKRELNSLSFNDITKLAIDILLNNKELREKYKKKFRFIMIDEFQDNNMDSKNLLYLLAEKEGSEKSELPLVSDLEEGKIFLVGDEKQSIYAFRGADVSVFKSLSSEIGEQLELDVNYRSQAELVSFFNCIFSSIMGAPSIGKPLFEADFKPLKSKDSEDIKGRIIFNNCVYEKDSIKGDDEEERDATIIQSEAYSVAKLIKEMLETDNFLIYDEDLKIKARPKEKDIAILLRKSTHQNEYEKALRLQGIRYTVSEAKGVTSEAVFNDFYSILNLVLYPDDSVSLLSYLKGPFCRLKDSEISGCFAESDVSNKYVFDNLKEEYKVMIADLREKSSVLTLSELMDYVYYNLGYREFLITNPANQYYIEHYDYLYELACKFDKKGKTLSELLDYIRPMLSDNKKINDLNVMQEESVGVNIMTIHKSKGLGFPIVFVVDMGSTRDKNGSKVEPDPETDTPFFSSLNIYDCATGKYGFVNPVSKIYWAEADKKSVAELKRLLYVAMTRAKYHLVFSAFIEVGKSGMKIEDDSMLQMFLQSTGFDFKSQRADLEYQNELAGEVSHIEVEGRVFSFIPENETFSKTRLTIENLRKNKVWYEQESEDKFDTSADCIAVTSIGKMEDSGEAGTFELSGNLDESEGSGTSSPKVFEKLPAISSDNIISKYNCSTEFGTLAHAYIENIIKGMCEKPEIDVKTESEEDRITLFQDAENLAKGFINSFLYKKIKDYEISSEKEYYMYDEDLDSGIRGVIDLLAISEKEVIIIDFKTDRFKNSAVHTRQLSYYKKALKTIYPDKSVVAYLVYLRDAENFVEV